MNGPTVSRTLYIDSPSGEKAYNVVLTTDIEHEWSGDLSMTLTSPQGTEAVISTRNPQGGAAGYDNVFAGTTWSVLGTPVTLASMSDGVAEALLGSEQPLSVFSGENPRGNWTFRVVDAFNHPGFANTGRLVSWGLTVSTSSCNFVPHTLETAANNLATVATPLTLVSNIAGVGIGSVFPSGDTDFWSVLAPASSRLWAMVDTGGTLHNGATSRDAKLRLLGSDRTTVLETDLDDGIANGADASIEGREASTIAGAPLAAAGAYYLHVDEQAGGLIDPYRIYAVVSDASPSVVSPASSSTTLVTAGTAFGFYRSSISAANPDDVFAIRDVPRNALLAVWVDGNPGRTGSPFDALVRFDDDSAPATSPLMTVDSSGAAPLSAESFVYKVPSDGNTYYVQVAGAGGAVGDYENHGRPPRVACRRPPPHGECSPSGGRRGH